MVYCSELDRGGHFDENLIKQVTGGDLLRGRMLYEQPFEFEPTHKLWVLGNYKPRIEGRDNAIWRRVVLIPFEATITDTDKQLPEKLKNELPGILNWAIQGCLDWRRSGLGIPESVAAATRLYREEEDHIAIFIEECCTRDDDAATPTADLYAHYKQWCSQNGVTALGKPGFGRELSKSGFTHYRTNQARGWNGLRLLQ